MASKFTAVLPNGEVITRTSEKHEYGFVVVAQLNGEAVDCRSEYVRERMAKAGGSWSVLGWRSKREDAEALKNGEANRRYVLKSHYLNRGRTRRSVCAVEVVDEYGPAIYSQVLVLKTERA